MRAAASSGTRKTLSWERAWKKVARFGVGCGRFCNERSLLGLELVCDAASIREWRVPRGRRIRNKPPYHPRRRLGSCEYVVCGGARLESLGESAILRSSYQVRNVPHTRSGLRPSC